MKMIAMIAVAAAVALSGCASMAMKSRVELVALDESTCDGYGFKRGTDSYAQCMMELDQLRIRDNADRRRAFAASMRQLSRDLNPPTVTCNTNGSAFGSGNYVYGNSTTTCR